jgi:hypothetical protein
VYHTGQGYPKKKIENKRHTVFYNYKTTILICLYGFTLYGLMVTIVDGGPAYEGKKTKHREKKYNNDAEPYDCSIFKPRLLSGSLFLQLGLAKTG